VFLSGHLRAGLRLKDRYMGSFAARTVRHSGCRPLRQPEIEYLQSIVRDAADDNRSMLWRGLVHGVLFSSVFWFGLAIWVFFETPQARFLRGNVSAISTLTFHSPALKLVETTLPRYQKRERLHGQRVIALVPRRRRCGSRPAGTASLGR